MSEKCSFKAYLCNLKTTMVASKLLGIFHIIAQIVMVLSMLSYGFSAFAMGFFQGLAILILTIILIPIVSLFVRFWFELISVQFSINGNLTDIKQGLFGPCDCEDCDGDCGCEIEIEKVQEPKPAPKKKAPTKKPVEKKPASKKSTKKK
jgi:hypothetical protein